MSREISDPDHPAAETTPTIAHEANIVPRKPNPTAKETIGQRIARTRQAKGFTQEEPGAEIGVSKRMMSHYEQGWPPSYVLPKVAKALGTSLDELAGLEPPRNGTGRPPGQLRLWRRLQKIERLPLATRKAVLKVIDGLLQSA